MKPYPAYRDTDLPWLPKIPNHWEAKPLFVVMKERQRKNIGNKETNVLSLSYGNIVRRDVESNFGLLPESFETYQIVQPGNIVLRLTDLQNDKRSLRTGQVKEQGIITSAYTCLEVGKQLDDNFAHYLLYGYDLLKVFYQLGAGVRQTMKFDDLKRLLVLVPSLEEQQAIAAYLDRQTAKIDALISKKQRLLDLLAEQRSALIDHTTTKGLNPKVKMKDSGLKWLGKIPEHWDIIRSKRLFGLRNVKASNSDKQLTVSQEFGVITQEDYMAKGSRVVQVIKGADILKHVEPNDFIISMRSFQGGIEWSKIGGSTSSAYVVLIPNEEVYCPFFAYFLKSNQYIQALQSTSNLVRDGQALRYTNFCLVDLPVVPLEEQIAIAEYLDKKIAGIDALVEKVYQAIERLQEYRAALISSVVTGKVDVSEVN